MKIHTKITMLFLLFTFCSVNQGQIIEYTEKNESVFFHLGMRYIDTYKKNKEKNPIPRHLKLILFIDNQSNDTILIKNFDYNIRHKMDGRLFENERTFSWEFLTLSNKIPKDIVFVSSGYSMRYIKRKILFIKIKQKLEFPDDNFVDIVIPPNSYFVSDVNLLFSSFMHYWKGYYKLCLYYKNWDTPVAEMFLKKE